MSVLRNNKGGYDILDKDGKIAYEVQSLTELSLWEFLSYIKGEVASIMSKNMPSVSSLRRPRFQELIFWSLVSHEYNIHSLPPSIQEKILRLKSVLTSDNVDNFFRIEKWTLEVLENGSVTFLHAGTCIHFMADEFQTLRDFWKNKSWETRMEKEEIPLWFSQLWRKIADSWAKLNGL